MNIILTVAVIFICFAFLLAAAAAAVRAFQITLFKKNAPILPEKFTVTAHTGCLGTEPNTVGSMQKGAKAGADIVEFDLNFGANNEPVLSHGAPESNAVRLNEAFKFLSEHKNIKANVDVKSTLNLGAVRKLAEEYGVTEQLFFTGVFAEDVSAVERSCPQIPFYLNYSVNSHDNDDIAYLSHIIETVQNCGAIGINIHYKGASKRLVEAFHSEGLLVSLWTVNGKLALCRSLTLCPDNITTKRPERLRSLLEKSYSEKI